MQKAVYSLFVLLAVFSIIDITPSAFADHSKVDINMAVGSSNPGCETNNMCYMPYNAALGIGGEAVWHNIDTMAHTVTSGTMSDDDVCAALSVLSQVTVPPTVITTVLGMKQSGSQPGVEEPAAFSTVADIPPSP